MPVFSLPSKWGIGTVGKPAFDFVDFLSSAGQSLWQVLPMCPVDMYGSPYMSESLYAGNPFYIDIDALVEDGLLSQNDVSGIDLYFYERVDYQKLNAVLMPLFKKAFSRFDPQKYAAQYDEFIKENDFWINDYALYKVLKDKYNCAFCDFPKELKCREEAAIKKAKDELSEQIDFQIFLQFEFFSQWKKLKTYANGKGIKIIGDLPIYPRYDSADVWSSPESFMLDENLSPVLVAGTPPDAFSATGQLWGNPVYDFEAMKNGEVPYLWWKNRIKKGLQTYDIIRLDHFRAFAAFYGIPAGDDTAQNGRWISGPNIALFEDSGENLPIIAEDLGIITDDVRELLARTGFAGMSILQFGFDGMWDNPYFPEHLKENTVCYIGTHDNMTLKEFELSGSFESKRAKEYAGEGDFCRNMLKVLLESRAETAIFTLQDYLALGGYYRINTPGTKEGNWSVRFSKECFSPEIASDIYKLTKNCGR